MKTHVTHIPELCARQDTVCSMLESNACLMNSIRVPPLQVSRKLCITLERNHDI